jgi:hypothetical protein
LRGKLLPVRVLEPLSGAACPLGDGGLTEFADGLAAFRAGAWQEACDRFSGLATRFPGDGPSRYYDLTAREFLANPPPTWSGAIRLTAK